MKFQMLSTLRYAEKISEFSFNSWLMKFTQGIHIFYVIYTVSTLIVAILKIFFIQGVKNASGALNITLFDETSV